MYNFIAVLTLFSALAMGSGAANADAQKSFGDQVSLAQLIANPEKYNGNVVVVSGWVTYQYENNTLCTVRNPASSKDCLWLIFEGGYPKSAADARRLDAVQKQWQQDSGKVGTVRGTFDMSDKGHLNCCSGALSHVVKAHRR